jgi:hypothetical protein
MTLCVVPKGLDTSCAGVEALTARLAATASASSYLGRTG